MSKTKGTDVMSFILFASVIFGMFMVIIHLAVMADVEAKMKQQLVCFEVTKRDDCFDLLKETK